MTGSAQNPGRTRNGFSYVELVVVLAVIAVVTSIAVPRYASSITRYRTQTALARIAADLDLAASYAQSVSADVTVTFDKSLDTYGFNSLLDPDHPSRKYGVDLGNAPYNADLISADFGGNPSVTFNGFGESATSGIVLLGVGGETHQLTFDHTTGKATY